MKKRFIIIMVLVLSYFLVGCQLFNPNRNEPQYKIYEMAKEVGFEGTYEEWLQTIRGIDGTSIKKVELDKDNNLIITLSNGEVINVGNVKGDKGDEIELSVIDGYIKWHYKGSNEWYNLIEVSTLIGEKGDKGDEVEISVIDDYIKWHYKDSDEWYNLIEVSTLIGLQGPKGEDGVSIVKTELDKDNNLIITLSNGEVINVGNVKGNTGKSAYEIYKEKHPEYTKTEEEWLDDLVNGRLATKEVYTVKFITNTEEVIEDQTVEENKKVVKPKNPEKTGYTFIGWFNEYDEQWVFGGYNVTSDVTLYAKFKINTYKIITDIESVEVEYGGKYVLKDAEASGYTFNGWFDENYNMWSSSGVYEFTHDLILHCGFLPNTYRIIIDNETIIEVEYDSSFTLPVLEKEGYRFKYFEYEGEEFKDTVYKFDKDINITSIYGPLFTLFFDTEGGEDLESIEYHTANIETLPTPVKVGSVFLGWYYNEEVFNVPYNNEPLTDIKLTAHYRSIIGDYEVEEIENNEIKILKYNGASKILEIPNILVNKVVTILGDECFKDNTQVETVILPQDIKEVDNDVFNGCTSLKEIIFNSGIKTYKDNILLNCNSLESITIDVLNQSLIGFFDYEESNIPSTFTSINYLSKDKANDVSKMFNGIKSHLFDINIASSWNEVPKIYFRDNKIIRNVNLEEGITSIGGSAFSSCKFLETITLPDTLTKIDSYAFYECSSLQTITLPNTLTNIGTGVFFNCTSLQTITLPNTINAIELQMFVNCASLQAISLPNTITSIGSESFSNCTSLTDVFYEGSKSDFINKITIGTNNDRLTNANIHYNSDVTLEYIETEKYSYVLTSNNEICSLVCNDKTVETIDLGEEFKDYTIYSLGYGVFESCTSLKTITLPDTITSIGSSAFSHCSSLQSITLPKTITSIGRSAFDNCSSLTDVYYDGTEEEFSKILVGDYNSYFTNATIHYNESAALE